ncbi:helix-turn-helix transcriptional regulator [Pleionea sediminis]|uniref:helix-turn-helix transcriptional regulator n=1 Tax=Pleionea sediminis TaxID=2569479 RepID=UPI001186FB29|nr:YafY family protein [Pleionea sediminis]
MRRADRLFQIIELLRSRQLTTAAYLADKLEVSVRTIYRDIADLQKSGVDVEGEAGIGYRLRYYDLAPLMFNSAELEALLSGIKLAKAWMDSELRADADAAISKIEKILPEQLKKQIKANTLLAPDFHVPEAMVTSMAQLRSSINRHQKVELVYIDLKDKVSERKVRPLGLVFWGQVWTLVAWCEKRDDFRNFRLDRIQNLHPTIEPFQQEKGQRLADYIERERNDSNGG